MGSMTGVKGQSKSPSLLKIDRMLGRLEYEEETRMLFSVVGC